MSNSVNEKMDRFMNGKRHGSKPGPQAVIGWMRSSGREREKRG